MSSRAIIVSLLIKRKPMRPIKLLAIITIVVVTFLAFRPALNNGFTSWDDTAYVNANPSIKGLSFKHIQTIFTTTVLYVYTPLTSLFFAIEYFFAHDQPFLYHLDNVLLHLAVTVLIFVFAQRLGLNVLAAFLAALLFGIHPVHVESVAWVSERKDVLYSLFYMLAILQYWQYVEQRKRADYWGSIIFCFLSMLAKPMALSLPLILLLIDWMKGRTIDKKIFFEKLPHVLIIIPIALITYIEHLRIPTAPLTEAILTWIWTATFYIDKFFLPVDLIPVYSLPQPISLTNIAYLNSFVWLTLIVLLSIRLRKNRWFIFAIMFYVLSMFFLFRVDQVMDKNVVADRFMYLPSLGFCLWFGMAVEQLLSKLRERKLFVEGGLVLAVIFLLLGWRTHQQTQIWKDSLTLWNYVIEHNPSAHVAYINRSNEYVARQQYDLALKDINSALSLNARYDLAEHNKGRVFEEMGNKGLALAQYNKAIDVNPDQGLSYNNRGIIYLEQNQYDLALSDFNQAIAITPATAIYYTNRASAYLKLKKYEEALNDLNQAIYLNPFYALAYCNRGVWHLEHDHDELALNDFNQALKLDPHLAKAYNNRGNFYLKMQNNKQALADYDQAIALDQRLGEAYFNRGIIYFKQRQYDLSITNNARALELDPHYRDAYHNRSLAFAAVKKYQEALADALKAQALGDASLDQHIEKLKKRLSNQ